MARDTASLRGEPRSEHLVIHLTSQTRYYNPGDPETVVFDPLSGNTHLLTAVGAFILAELQTARSPVTLDELHRSLDARGSREADTESLLPVVTELEQLGLVKLVS